MCENSQNSGLNPSDWAHFDTTTTRRGSAKRNAAFTLQHGAMLTTRQPEGCVPVVVSRCAPQPLASQFSIGMLADLCFVVIASSAGNAASAEAQFPGGTNTS